MQHPAQDHSCCAHTRRVPPISRFAANRETGDFPIPDSESEIGDSLPVSSSRPRFPAKSEIGGTEIADFRV